MKIGLISDTHGIWRPEISEIFRGVHQILHAGDVGRQEILEQLAEIAPVAAVRGNVDLSGEPSLLPSEVETELAGVRLLMRHAGASAEAMPSDLKRLLAMRGIGVLVFGHSHQRYSRYLNGTLLFNPGAAGPRRVSQPLSVATMEIEVGKISWKFWELEE